MIVTGDISYHEALDARERGLAIIDAGHAATEKPVINRLAALIRRHFPGIRISTFREPEIFLLNTNTTDP